ncbi:MAG: NAD-dependent epimerase/dehydratase family protein [Microgenomates group bacterium]
MNKRIVAVTGATGTVGRVVVKILLEKGFGVRILAHSRKHGWTAKEVEVVEGDLTNVIVLKKMLRNVDGLIHCAATMDKTKSWEEFWEINVKTVGRIMNMADEKTKLVMVSSVVVYADTGEKTGDEKAALREDAKKDKYIQTKIEALKVIRAQKRKVVTVMPSIVVDVNSWKKYSNNINSKFLAWIWQNIGGGIPGGIMAAIGSKERIINIVDVHDLGMGIVLAYEAGKSGEEYILGGQNIRVIDYLQKLSHILGKKYLRFRLPAGLVKWLAMAKLVNMSFKSEKAKKELGYRLAWKM